MMNLLRIMSSFLLLTFFSQAKAVVYEINFGSPESYVSSLQHIREQLGRPLTNIANGNTQVFELNATQPQAVIIQPLGVPTYYEDHVSEIQFVMDAESLYIIGFINTKTKTFYRFAGVPALTVPGVDLTVQLTSTPSYTQLENVAGFNRVGMVINRYNLSQGELDLLNFSGDTLEQTSSRAMLRYITVISEALRFRQIQREFRIALNNNMTEDEYIFSQGDSDLTRSWGGISEAAHYFDGESANQIIARYVSLNGLYNVLRALALVKNCNKPKIYGFELYTSDKCDVNKAQKIRGGIYSSDVLISIGVY